MKLFFSPTSVSLSSKLTDKYILIVHERSYLSMYYLLYINYVLVLRHLDIIKKKKKTTKTPSKLTLQEVPIFYRILICKREKIYYVYNI